MSEYVIYLANGPTLSLYCHFIVFESRPSLPPPLICRGGPRCHQSVIPSMLSPIVTFIVTLLLWSRGLHTTRGIALLSLYCFGVKAFTTTRAFTGDRKWTDSPLVTLLSLHCFEVKVLVVTLLSLYCFGVKAFAPPEDLPVGEGDSWTFKPGMEGAGV
jgi:hypothetical protein